MRQMSRKSKRAAAARKPAARVKAKPAAKAARAVAKRSARKAPTRAREREVRPADQVAEIAAAVPSGEPAATAPQTATTEVMSHSIRMDRQCTLREAEAFKSALLAAEDSSGDFIVHAGDVERIDTAGLQLLVAFMARLKLVDRRLVWSSVSPALRRGADQLGLAEVLELP